MIRRVVNQLLKAALSELFITSSGDTVQMSMGSDMFSSSNVHLKDLTLRPDIFDACLHPLKLVSGHFGILKVEGVAEVAMGAPIKVYVENIFLLFTFSKCEDAEHIQVLRKVLLELISNGAQHTMITHLLRKVLGLANDKSSDSSKQRKIIYMAMKHVFKILQVSVKKIHVRIEFDPNGTRSGREAVDLGSGYSALGMTLPSVKIGQNLKLSGISEEILSVVGEESDPSISLQLKALQVYCDYDIKPYQPPNVGTEAQQRSEILKRFSEGWATEVHTAVLLPFDLEVFTQIALDVVSGNLAPKLTVAIPKLRVAFDPRQLEVFKDLLESIVNLVKRASNLSQLMGIFNDINPPPRIHHVKGLHILPHLLIGKKNAKFPAEISVPRDQSTGVVDLLQKRSERDVDMAGWARHMWRHAIEMVLRDLRPLLPLGRWKSLILLCWARKEYVFTYGKYLRHKAMITSKTKGTSPLSPADVIRLHEFEMTYPMSTILQFREVAVAVFTAQDLFMKRKKSKSASRSKRQFSQALSWRDVLSMLTILKEEQRGVISYVSPANAPGAGTSGAVDTHRSRKESVDEEFDDSSIEAAITGTGGRDSLAAALAAEKLDTTDTADKEKPLEERGSGSGISLEGPDMTPVSDSIVEEVLEDTVEDAVSAGAAVVEEVVLNTQSAADASDLVPVTTSRIAVGKNSKEKSTNPGNATTGSVSTTTSQEAEKKKGGFHNMIRKSLAGGSSNSTASPDGSSTVTPTQRRESVAAGASKLFSSMRHSTGMTPESRTSTPVTTPATAPTATTIPAPVPSSTSTADEAFKNSTKAPQVTNTSTSGTSTGASPSVRKTAILSTMSAAITGKSTTGGGVKRSSNADESQLGENRFNTLLARTLHLSESVDGFDGGMSVVDSDSEESDEGSIITTDEHEVITSNTIVHDYASVVDAVRWVIRSHQSPISVLLPNARLEIGAMNISLRLPVENGSRRLVASIEIDQTAALLSASSTAGNSATSESVKLLTGLLVILKASIQSLSIQLHRTHKGKDVALSLLTTKPNDAFLNACMIVDVPPGGTSSDKAVDLQVNLGSLDFNLKKDGFSIFVEPKVRANLARCLYCLHRMKLHVAVLFDHTVVVEHHADCLGVPSVLLRHIHYAAAGAVKSSVMTANTDAHMDLHKKSVTDYLNSKRFYSIFSNIMPKGVLSLGVHTGSITANMLSSASLRTFTIIWMRDLMERALTDPNATPSLYVQSTLNSYLKATTRNRTRSTKTSQRMSQYLNAKQNKRALTTNTTADIDPVNIDIKKSPDPFPLISINAPGLALTLPIDDDTLCRVLSLMISGLIPFYTIRAVPMPVQMFQELELDDPEEEVGSEVGEGVVAEGSVVGGTGATVGSIGVAGGDDVCVGDGKADRGLELTAEETKGSSEEPESFDGKIPESKLPIASSPTSTFRRCDFSSFLLRAASSSMFKKEMKPSGRPLYTPVAVYAYSMSSFMENIANFVPMPPELAAEDTSTLRGGSHVPPVLVIQIHIPGQHAGISMSSMLQQKKKDIPGVSLLVYFKLTMGVRKELQKLSEATAPVRLFNEWCKYAYKDQTWQSRMKMYPSVLEIGPNGEANIPPLLQPLDRKAIALSKTGSVFKGPNYIEIDVNTHSLSGIGGGLGGITTGISTGLAGVSGGLIPGGTPQMMFEHISDMYTQVGFAVEGKNDDELPEVLCGCVGFNAIDSSKFFSI